MIPWFIFGTNIIKVRLLLVVVVIVIHDMKFEILCELSCAHFHIMVLTNILVIYLTLS